MVSEGVLDTEGLEDVDWWCRAGRSLHAAHQVMKKSYKNMRRNFFWEEERQHWCAVEVVYDLVEEVTKLCHRFKDR